MEQEPTTPKEHDMCDALERLTEQEGRELKESVDDLVKWKSKITGGIIVISTLLSIGMAVVLWIANRTFEKSDEMTAALISMEKELAVFRQEVKPFITAGPRFTADNYDTRIKADVADLKEWVREHLEKYEKRIDEVEKRMP